jgi:hypothetical protein
MPLNDDMEFDEDVQAAMGTTEVSSTELTTAKPKEMTTAGAAEPDLDFDFSEVEKAFYENVEAGEVKISRCAILQPGSDEIAGEVAGYSGGMIVNNNTREIYTRKIMSPWLLGKVSNNELFEAHAILIQPVFKLPNEYIKWKDRTTEGRGWHFKTLDKRDPRVRAGVWSKDGGTWGTKEGQEGAPPVTVNCNYLCNILDASDPSITLANNIIITFCKTSSRAGIDLTTAIATGLQKRIPPFGAAYYVYTTREKNDDGTFYKMNCVGFSSSVNPIATINQRAFLDAIAMHKKLSTPVSGYNLQCGLLSMASLEGEDSDGQKHNGNQDSGEFDPEAEIDTAGVGF